VAAVLKETGPDRWSVSLRAKQRLDVSAAATELGGGGHRLAAGFPAEGTAEDVLDALRGALARAPITAPDFAAGK
jgi:phosphoesterase RecJ-like protein